MKLPRFTAGTPPPRESGLARATDIGALTRTGDIEVWRGVSRLGGAMKDVAGLGFDAYQRRVAIDDTIEWGIATQRAKEGWREAREVADLLDVTMDMPLKDDPDYLKTLTSNSAKKTAGFIADALKDIEKDSKELSQGFSNPLNKARFENWYNDNYATFVEGLSSDYRDKLHSYQIAEMTKLWQDAAANGDTEVANSYIELMDKHELITPQAALKYKQQVEKIVIAYEQELAKSAIENLLINIAVESGWDAALDWLNDPKNVKAVTDELGIKLKDIDAIMGDLRTHANSQRTQQKLIQEQKDNEIGMEFLGLLKNKLEPTKPQLTFDTIEASDLSFSAKDKWFAKLQAFDNYSEGELKEAFTDKGEVLADIYDKIDKGTLTDELDTMVGNGLSPVTAERIKKEIRAPYEKDTEQLFKRIFGWSPELGFSNELSSFLYEKVLREWGDEVKRQDATGEKIVEIGRSIARPYFIEHLTKTMMGQEADISRMVELALGEEVEEIREEEKPKEEEGPRTKQDFIDEVSRLKKIDMGKAKSFYDAWAEKFEGTTEGEEGVEDFGLRPGGTPKGIGYLGVLQLKGGGVATEYSVGTTDVTGKEMDIPTLVPTLTQKEIDLLVNDIIPNKKPIPKAIMQKAIAHAKERIKQGKSVFFE